MPSASARTIVYKGLVIGGRLPDLYPDLRAPLERRLRGLPPALRHQHPPGLAARPAVPLDRPQRRDQHGPRQSRGGPRAGGRCRPRSAHRRGTCWRPARSCRADGSDSLSLDEALELLTTTGWELTPALLTAIPEALALRRAPHPHVATLRRRTAGFLAPWDGPAAIVFADGRPGRRAGRPERAAAGGLRGDAGPARGRRVGGGRGPVHRGRDGPAWPPRAGRAAARRAAAGARSSRTPRRRPGSLRALPIHDAPRPIHEDRRRRGRRDAPRGRDRCTRPRPALPRRPRRRARPARHQDDGARGARAAVEHGRRHADRRPRPARPARSPTTSARPSPRSRTRRSTRSASAWSWTCASSWAVGRRCSAGRRAGHGPFAWHARSSSTWTASSARSVPPARPVRTLDATWDPADGPAGLEAALDRLADGRRRRRPARHGGPASSPTRPGPSTGCRSRRSWRSAPSTPP